MYMYIICIFILYVYVYYMYMCAYVFHVRHHKATEVYEDYEVMKSENQTIYIYINHAYRTHVALIWHEV